MTHWKIFHIFLLKEKSAVFKNLNLKFLEFDTLKTCDIFKGRYGTNFKNIKGFYIFKYMVLF